MGTSSSNRMENRPRLRSDTSAEEHLASILQFLIRSGQVHIISTDQDESEEEIVPATTPPRIESPCDSSMLDDSEASLKIKQAAGLLYTNKKKRPKSVVSMCTARENGMFGNNAFTLGDKCKITNMYLPSQSKPVAAYHNKVFCGAYSTNGKTFMTACQDRYIRLYHTHRGNFELFETIQAKDVGWSVLDVAFSPDGEWIAYSSWSDSLHLCRLSDPDHQESLPLSPEDRRFCIFSIAFSSNGSEILGGANDGFLYSFDIDYNHRSLRFEAHTDDINTVAFGDRACSIFFTGGDDGLCKVWDKRTLNQNAPKSIGVLAGHRDGITYIDPKGDNLHLITNSKDQSIKLWDIRKFSSLNAQEKTRQAVATQNWDYRWQNVPKKLLANMRNNLDGDTSIMTYRGHSVMQTLIRCHFSPALTTGQRYIYTGCSSGRVVIYDVLTGEVVKILAGHKACVRDVSWHPERPEICSTSWDQTVLCWEYPRYDIDKIELPQVQQRRSARIAELRRRAEQNSDISEV